MADAPQSAVTFLSMGRTSLVVVNTPENGSARRETELERERRRSLRTRRPKSKSRHRKRGDSSVVPARPLVARVKLSAMTRKPELEFFDRRTIPWTPVQGRPGVAERVLARDPETGLLTRMVRWDAGLDTSPEGPVKHDHFEEVLILSGSMRDLTLEQTFYTGFYASRPPGMLHGPWTTDEGCVMLEIQYAV
jgi:hypothetical protein